MSVISQESINKRKAAYMVCYANATWSRHQAIMFGNEAARLEHENKMITLAWAMNILCGYSPEGECIGSRTVTYDEVCCAVKIADPCCVSNACSEDEVPQPSCDPAIVNTVLSAVQVSDRATIEAGPPANGDSYYVVGGTVPNVWSLNEIVTWNGSGWDAITPGDGDVIRVLDTNTLWTVLDSTTPGMLYPPVVAELVGGGGLYSIVSAYPQISANAGRDVELKGLINGSWVTLYLGPESAMAIPSNYLFGSTQVTNLVVVYLSGACRWESTASATPSFGQCGLITSEITPVADCGNGQFFLGIDITSTIGFPLGNIIAEVNGVPQLPGTPGIVGLSVLGNFEFTDSVRVRIQNAFDPACDYVSSPMVHPNMPVVNHTVYAAVDASFQSSAVPGRAYLIVSDEDSVPNTWAANVGKIWNGSDFVTVAEGEVTFTSGSVGLEGYWQMTGGVQTRVFAPATIDYNTISLVYSATMGTPATFVAGMDVRVTFECPGSGLVEIYNGPVAGFTQVNFMPVCSVDNVEVVTTYMPSCPISVPSDIDPFTPAGDPDPEFTEGGLNNAVYYTVIDPDDNIVVGGLFTAYGATPVGRFAILDKDGLLDETFNTAIGTGFNGPVRSFIRDSSGRFLIVGDFTDFNGTTVGRMARLNADGSLDTDFNTAIGTGFPFPAHYIIDLGDNTYIITGTFNGFNGASHTGIVKIDSTGALVPGFTGQFNSQAGPCFIDPYDGNVILQCGFSVLYNGTNIGAVATGGSYFKINPTTGDIVSTMLLGSKFNGWSVPLPLVDGTQIVVGGFTQYNGIPCNRIVKINADGTVNTAFQANVGSGFNDETTNANLLPNGQVAICMVGTATTFNGAASNSLVLMSQDGTRITTFNNGAGFAGGRTLFVRTQSDGSVVSIGWFTSFNALTRLRVARFS